MDYTARTLKAGLRVHGRYEILRILGAGGFGITYQVMDLQENRILALKEYMPMEIAMRAPNGVQVIPQKDKMNQYERFRNRFLEEAKLVYQFHDHPNIVKVRHLFYENNTAYYTMDYLEGTDLRQVLEQEKRITWERLKPVIAQVVTALEEVHAAGLTHCDISPDNIFIQRSGQVKLIDFGSAKNIMESVSTILLLKQGYSAPEQAMSNGKIGPWTDIYALAVTIYVACTGILPQSAIERLTNNQVKWPSQMGLAIPSVQWEAALQKAMAVKATERYQNVRQFWNDLLGGRQAVETRSAMQSKHKIFTPGIVCIAGYYANKQICPKERLIFGTQPDKCHVVFPQQIPGISGVHICFWLEKNQLMAMDMGSRYGSYLNGRQMTPGLVYTLTPDMEIEIGNRQLFRVIVMETG